MSLTSYRAAPPREGSRAHRARCGRYGRIGGPGGDLLSRALRHSTMGAGGFHGRVRDGIGCGPSAKATRSSNPPRISDQFSVVSCRTTRGGGSGAACGGFAAGGMCVLGWSEDDFHAWFPRVKPVDKGSRAYRAIRTGQLRALPRFHTRPIDVMVYHGPRGDLVLRWVSRLDAFSGYPVHT